MPHIERWEQTARQLVTSLKTSFGDAGHSPGTPEFALAGSNEWSYQTGGAGGFFTNGHGSLTTAGKFRPGATDRQKARHALTVCTNTLCRLSMANKVSPDAWRSWTPECAGRPEWQYGGDSCVFLWDEPLYGDFARAAGVYWDTPTGRIAVYGDEPNHSSRYVLYALCDERYRGRWIFTWTTPFGPGFPAIVDAVDLARLALFMSAQCIGDQFCHPWVQATGCSDRSFARGFATLSAASRLGILDARLAEKAVDYLQGPGFKAKYGVTPGADLNQGHASDTMVPPIGVAEPCYQYFGICLVPATLYDVANDVAAFHAATATALRGHLMRLATWTCDMQEDPAKEAPGYVTIPPALRAPGATPPPSLAPFIADGSAVRHYGDGTGSGKFWGIKSLRCAGALGDARSRSFADSLVNQVKAQVAAGFHDNVGWCTDENGEPLITV